jgi:sarcosine oxidase subunit gamma
VSAVAAAGRQVAFERRHSLALVGFKGPRAAEWAALQGLPLPPAANRFVRSADGGLLVARLGSTEFFVEESTAGGPEAAAGGTRIIAPLRAALDVRPPGVYPVLREDHAFRLGGDAVHDVLAQVCNVDFAASALSSMSVFMTLMVGVAVIVIPEPAKACSADDAPDGGRRYGIWCDPTFGAYLGETLETVMAGGGGITIGESA